MNILTFDIEEWFHILEHPETSNRGSWLKFESRIERNMEIIFRIIEDANTSATFFVVGWIAEQYPGIIKSIVDRGFEVGSHTHLHQLVYEQSRKAFANDVERSIKTLEDCSGKKVRSFRAPGFSIKGSNLWAFETLCDLGIEIDSSIFPAHRSHGGLPSYDVPTPSLLRSNGKVLKEFPINIATCFSKPIIFSGGGYFRLLPYPVIRSLTKRSKYVMSYFHPRDFDYEQPLVPGLSRLRQFKSYVGLKRCKMKLDKWLADFDFIDLKTADERIDWGNIKIVDI